MVPSEQILLDSITFLHVVLTVQDGDYTSDHVDKRCLAVLRGVSHEGRLIGGGARDRNRMVTQGAETAI